MLRRVIALSALLCLAAPGCKRAAAPNPAAKPRNVLLVTMDTTRADHLGAYGYALSHTGNIDRLAREGVRCDDHASVAPITMPAHTSIMTGLLPPAHGVRDNGTYVLADDAVTLAERLHSHGFETHAFVSAMVLDRRYDLAQGFETYDDDLAAEDKPPLFMIRERPAYRTSARVVRWLHDWGSSSRTPFFTWVHFFDPHQPYHPHSRFSVFTRTPYDAEIALVDQGIGDIIATLRELGAVDDTIVVVTADHGEGLGEHGELTHAFFVYDSTIHVPLILRAPGLLPGGRAYAGPTRHIDIAPTILGLLGIVPVPDMQGVDLTAALRGDAPAPALPQYCESMVTEVGFGMAPSVAVRDGGHKYIRVPKPELYDLHADPQERTNLVDSEPQLAARLGRRLDAILEDSKARALPTPAHNPMSEESFEALLALGYVARPRDRAAMQGLDPKDGLPLYQELENARHAAQAGNWRETIRRLQILLAKSPRNISALDVLGLAHFRLGELDAANAAYEQVLAIDANELRALTMMGRVASVQNDLTGARRLLERALAVAPHSSDVLGLLGYTAMRAGDPEQAESFFRRAAAASSRFSDDLRGLADMSFDREAYSEALGLYERAITGSPHDYGSLVQGGLAAAYSGDDAKAVTYLQLARDLRPDAWLPLFDLAWLRARAGDPGDALDLLQQTLPLGFNHLAVVEQAEDWETVRALPAYDAWLLAAREAADTAKLKPRAARHE